MDRHDAATRVLILRPPQMPAHRLFLMFRDELLLVRVVFKGIRGRSRAAGAPSRLITPPLITPPEWCNQEKHGYVY